MDRFTKTELRLNRATPSDASRTAPTSPEEEALLFQAESPAPSSSDAACSPDLPEASADKSNDESAPMPPSKSPEVS
jgi:hypothetical protein